MVTLINSLLLFLSIAHAINANSNSNPTDANTAPSVPQQSHQESKQKSCERLKTSLTYSQENAPQDISAVLPLIVERVNRELSGVVDVEVLFTGSEIHRRVGKHTVQCSVTRLWSSATSASSSSKNAEEGEGEGESQSLDYQTQSVDGQGRDVITQCFLVPFTIQDVNECELPEGHTMRHACKDPAICVNTLGSYECLCPSSSTAENEPNEIDYLILAQSEDESISSQFWNDIRSSEQSSGRTPWEKSLASSKQSSCPAKASTYKCCDSDAHSIDGTKCRSQFTCPVDPCNDTSFNDCVPTAECIKAKTPLDDPTYTCQCPSDLMGTGHKCRRGIDIMPPQPKVKFDGITPTDETIQHGFYCGCTKPIVDHCAGYDKCTEKNQICAVSGDTQEPHCVCKSGYVYVDTFGCVDESPPTLKLRNDEYGDGVTYLKQGDTYKEYAVDVIDDNAEDYKRSLKIAYSRPLPDGCEVHLGTFDVNYSVAMPWTNPPYAQVTRKVVIEDIDECSIDVHKYETQCPQIIPHCDVEHGAVCENTVGSYTCKCPEYTSGDGFLFVSSIQRNEKGQFIDAPVGYKGGTGCVDTSKPTIEVLGPNPKVFRIPKCGGLSGIMVNAKKETFHEDDEKLVEIQRDGYEDDIKKMIEATAGAELCATSTRTKPKPTDCVRAIDHTYLGNVDLSLKVTVGSPVRLSSLEWKVPYNVMDDAGNTATTVWRKVIVEEVDLFDMEEKIRTEVLADKEFEVKEAVQIALEKERKMKKSQKTEVNLPRTRDFNKNNAGSCLPCDVEGNGKELSITECYQQCGEKLSKLSPTCKNSSGRGRESLTFASLLQDLFSIGEEALSSSVIICAVITIVLCLQVLRTISGALSRRGGWYYLDEDDEKKEEEMLGSVTYFSPDGRQRQRQPTPSYNDMPSSTSPMPSASYFSPVGTARPMNGNQLFPIERHPNAYGSGQMFSPESQTNGYGSGHDFRSPGSSSRRQQNTNIPNSSSPIPNGSIFHH